MKKSESKVNVTPNGFNAFKLSLVNDNLSHLLGEVLTVIDASMEGERNKAIKDLIRRSFSEQQRWFEELSWKYEMEENEGKNEYVVSAWEDGLVPYDQDKKYFFA